MKNVLAKRSQGITLIALIITVIVMLILAAVAINMTIGDNGIFKKSDEGAQIYKNSANNEAASLNGIDKEMGDLIDQYHNENTNYTMVDGVPVPKGFTHTEGTKETGFVIKNDTDGNEFVWVPVEEGSGYTYDRYAFAREGWDLSLEKGEIDPETKSYKFVPPTNTQTSDMAPEEEIYVVEAMPSDEKASVEKYKGYYIGRYETGYELEEIQTRLAEVPTRKVLKVQKGLEILSNITIEEAKELAEELYQSNNYVKSKICSSYAWDTALKFIETKNPDWIYNSEGGNYTENLSERSVLARITGYHSINNIYDMGGNAWEWTSEELRQGDITAKIIRGGGRVNTANEYPAVTRFPTGDGIEKSYELGFRITLFL